jgi:hypothetical protein
VKPCKYLLRLFFFIIDTSTIFYQQLIEGLKWGLEQNKEIFKAIHENKVAQESFQKEFREKMADISEKMEQLITPDDSYWEVNSNIIYRYETRLINLLLFKYQEHLY